WVGQPRGHAPGFGKMSVRGRTPGGRPGVNGSAAAAAPGPAGVGVGRGEPRAVGPGLTHPHRRTVSERETRRPHANTTCTVFEAEPRAPCESTTVMVSEIGRASCRERVYDGGGDASY